MMTTIDVSHGKSRCKLFCVRPEEYKRWHRRRDGTLTSTFIPTQDATTEYLLIRINGSADLFRVRASTHGIYMHLVFRGQFADKVLQAWTIQVNGLAPENTRMTNRRRTEV